MSRSSFDRSDAVWPTNSAELSSGQADLDDVEADNLYIERDSLLEDELLQTSLEDYDDLLSLAQDDGFGFEE